LLQSWPRRMGVRQAEPEALHVNGCCLFFFAHRGKAWGLLGGGSGITLMSPNVLKSNNTNMGMCHVDGASLGYQLLLFVRVELCGSGGVLLSLTFCCPCPVCREKETQNLCAETGFCLGSLYAEGSSNGLGVSF